MDKQELQTAAKPFIWGLVVGVAGLAIIGFGTGAVVMTSSAEAARASAVSEAQVQQLASLCERQAVEYRSTLTDAPDLGGWEQRDARRELATRFAIVMPGQESADSSVIRACADRLG